MVSTPIRSILVVCTGNICRSPMAEGVLKDAFRSHGLDQIRIESTGTFGWDTEPPTPQAVQACKETGLDIAALRSGAINGDKVDEADLILAMEENHLDIIRDWFRTDGAKLRLLGDFHPEEPGMEIPDPYGKSVRHYRKVLERIRQCADGLVRHLKEQAQKES
ncbi:MAG: low molecular weight protein-tyrosine-phosphatase [Desulfococcaceae bacterium]